MDTQESLVNRAEQLFNDGFNCAQSSYAALCEHWGIKPTPRIATGFGGGIGRTGGACGILTGSLMALGMLAGIDDPKDVPGKERMTKVARDFIEAFRAQRSAITCNDLLDLDMSAPNGHQVASERKTKANICMPLMKSTMILMDEFVKKEGLAGQ